MSAVLEPGTRVYLWCAAAISTAVLGAGLVDLTDNIPLGEPSDLSRQLAVPHLAEALDLLGQLVSRFIEKAFQSAGEAFSCAVKAKQRISFFSPANAVLRLATKNAESDFSNDASAEVAVRQRACEYHRCYRSARTLVR